MMNLLLDTHIALWAVLDDEQVSGKARSLILDPGNDIYVSAASIWEIAIKRSLGKLPIDLSAAQLEALFRRSGFQMLSIQPGHAAAVEQLPVRDDHKDPFDRLLVAQASSEPMVLLTQDAHLAAYGDTVVCRV